VQLSLPHARSLARSAPRWRPSHARGLSSSRPTPRRRRWGTRLQHVAAICVPLAIADHASIALWNKVLLQRVGYAAGTTLSFAATPGPLLVHGFT
jgi:hypothetical protein